MGDKGTEGARPRRGRRAPGKGVHRRGGRGVGRALGSSWAGKLCPGPGPGPTPCPGSCPGARLRGPGRGGPSARGSLGPAEVRRELAGPRGEGGRSYGPASAGLESPRFPSDPGRPSQHPGTWPEAGERWQAAAADDEVEREGAHAPAQAGQPCRQLLHGMGAPGAAVRGPDGQSRAARAPAPAATSWGRSRAPRPAAGLRASRGRTPRGAPPPAPRPTPPPAPAAAASPASPPGPRGPPPPGAPR